MIRFVGCFCVSVCLCPRRACFDGPVMLRHGTTQNMNYRKMAETSNPEVLLELYHKADRLRPLLEPLPDQNERGPRDSPTTERGDGAGQASSYKVSLIAALSRNSVGHELTHSIVNCPDLRPSDSVTSRVRVSLRQVDCGMRPIARKVNRRCRGNRGTHISVRHGDLPQLCGKKCFPRDEQRLIST